MPLHPCRKLNNNKILDLNDMHPKSQALLEVYIFMAKKRTIQKQYSAEFKISVIIERDHHNNERISTKLKGMSPVQYRTHSPEI